MAHVGQEAALELGRLLRLEQRDLELPVPLFEFLRGMCQPVLVPLAGGNIPHHGQRLRPLERQQPDLEEVALVERRPFELNDGNLRGLLHLPDRLQHFLPVPGRHHVVEAATYGVAL